MDGAVGEAGAAAPVITAEEQEHGPEQELATALHHHVTDPPVQDHLQTLETVTVSAVSTRLLTARSE